MALICLIVSMSIVVYADGVYLSYGSQSGNITIQDYSNIHSTWRNIISAGISAWDNSSANVSISVSANSNNTISVADYGDSWYENATQYYNIITGHTYKFNIKINSYKLIKDSNYSTSFAQSTVVHEFGHIFWLDDNPSTGNPSIMNYGRDRYTVIIPQQLDINHVNAKY